MTELWLFIIVGALAVFAAVMMLLSDNTSTNVLIAQLGMDAINRRMAPLGARTASRWSSSTPTCGSTCST